MVSVAQFEEKTYEKYFGHELAKIAGPTFSPGQVAEGYLGFDEAFFLPSYAHLDGMSLQEIDVLADAYSDLLPDWRFNLFVQYKRPEYVRGHRAAEWSSWGQPYYRYQLVTHQQDALANVAAAAGTRAEVIYAAPAFWRSKTLFEAAGNHSVVSLSNVALATSMQGHSRYSYIAPGKTGVAHSDPENVEAPSIEEILRRGADQEPRPFRAHLEDLARSINAAAGKRKTIQNRLDDARRAILSSAGLPIEVSQDRAAFSLATVIAFRDTFGTAVYLFAASRLRSSPPR